MDESSLVILIGVAATAVCSIITAIGGVILAVYTARIKAESDKAATLAAEAKLVRERDAAKLAIDLAATKVATQLAVKTATESKQEAEIRQRQLSEDLKGITLQIDGRLTQLLETVAKAERAAGRKEESDYREAGKQ